MAAGIAVIVAIAVQSLWIPIDADVSWLITVSERVLAGDRLYVDILEVNPPASVWMYIPLVWLAQLAGLKPEAVVAGAFVAAALASVALTARMALKLDRAPSPFVLVGALAFVTLVLPMGLFAQREHAALLLAFPTLTAMALLAEGKPLGRVALDGSGAAAGLIIVIKPYFVLAVVGPAVWAAFERRSLSPMWPAIGAALLAIATYALAILTLAHPFLELVPTIARTYGAMHEVWWKVALGPALYPAVCAILAILLRAPRIPTLGVVWALGAVGFIIAAWAQAKNYPNHALPQCALALAALTVVLCGSEGTGARRRVVTAALAAVALCQMYAWTIVPDPAVAAAIQQSGASAPRVMALSPNLATGHPVTRNVGGAWVGDRAGLFTAAAARFVGLGDPEMQRAYREDVRAFARDMEREEPDVVLVHAPTKAWLMRDPEIAESMRDYRFEARGAKTEVWVRR